MKTFNYTDKKGEVHTASTGKSFDMKDRPLADRMQWIKDNIAAPAGGWNANDMFDVLKAKGWDHWVTPIDVADVARELGWR